MGLKTVYRKFFYDEMNPIIKMRFRLWIFWFSLGILPGIFINVILGKEPIEIEFFTVSYPAGLFALLWLYNEVYEARLYRYLKTHSPYSVGIADLS